MNTLGAIIRFERIKSRIKQKDLAETMYVSCWTISEYEHGKKVPYLHHLKEMSILFGKPIEVFLEAYVKESTSIDRLLELLEDRLQTKDIRLLKRVAIKIYISSKKIKSNAVRTKMQRLAALTFLKAKVWERECKGIRSVVARVEPKKYIHEIMEFCESEGYSEVSNRVIKLSMDGLGKGDLLRVLRKII